MPKVITLQTSFNSGVLDPRLAARTDLQHFYQGAEEAENVITMPQGGVKRRPGMKFIYSIANGSTSTGRLASFAFNVEQTYLLLLTASNIFIFKDGAYQAVITTPYLESELFDVQWTQSADTMILVHKDHQPRQLVRGASHTAWTLSTITLSNIPQYDYAGISTQLTQAISSSSTTVPVDSTTGFPTTGKLLINNEQLSYTGVTATSFTGLTRGLQDTGLVGSETHKNDDLVTTIEDVWSTARGWPKSATFFQGRLWFGGSKQRPQTIWGSRTNDFYNFRLGTSLDDEGIDVTLDTDQVNAITSVYAGRHLNIFTTGGEFTIKDAPITPAKVAVRRETLYGSTSIPPKMIDGSVIYIDRTGKSVREFLFSYNEDAYTSGTVSLLASHLLNAPVDMDVSKGTATDDANYVYFVNGDGTVAVFNTLRSQEVSGWTKWTTAGTIESVVVVVDEVYFVVKRTINGQVYRFVEQLDSSSYTDANRIVTLGSAGTTVAGFSHLVGHELRVRVDGEVRANATPAVGGVITLSESGTVVEAGIDFTTTIKTMPINMDFQDGPTLTRKKRIVKVVPNVYQSLGISINGERLIDRNFGLSLDSAPTPYTGLKEMYLLGWTELAQVTITQTDPTPMTILGLAIEVEA
mgnify:CR=1 FL=1|tara:strand:+ start:550 stop:2457 length:1908 start_codon:yes stop_codon:yes gene_type:complete